MPQKITLNIDEENQQILLEAKKVGGFETEGEVIGEAISTLLELMKKANDGYTEMVLRNPQIRKQITFALSPHPRQANALQVHTSSTSPVTTIEQGS